MNVAVVPPSLQVRLERTRNASEFALKQSGRPRSPRLASPSLLLPFSFTHDVFTRAMLRSAQVKVLNRGALRAARKNAAVFQAARTLATKAAAPTAVPSALPRAANLRANASESRTLLPVASASDSSGLHPPERPRARERAPRVGPRNCPPREASAVDSQPRARSTALPAHRGRAHKVWTQNSGADFIPALRNQPARTPLPPRTRSARSSRSLVPSSMCVFPPHSRALPCCLESAHHVQRLCTTCRAR